MKDKIYNSILSLRDEILYSDCIYEVNDVLYLIDTILDLIEEAA